MDRYFEIISEIAEIETIAVRPSIRDRASLDRQYGVARWRKLKGIATIRLADGRQLRAEIHWYEAHGIGRHRFKIKRWLE